QSGCGKIDLATLSTVWFPVSSRQASSAQRRSSSSTGCPSGPAAMLTMNGESSRPGGWVIAINARAQAADKLVSLWVYNSGSLIVVLLRFKVSVRRPARVLVLGDAGHYRPAVASVNPSDPRANGCEHAASNRLAHERQVRELGLAPVRQHQRGPH